MIDFSYKDLAHILNAELINPIYYKKFDNISSDSRNITENSIFFAFKGEKFDGHDYIYNVINSGVKSIVINKDRINDFKNLQITIFAVDDTIKAYGDLAKVYKNRIKAKVIAITGSNGKTTTKELLAHILSTKYNVVKTEKNDNNHIGVPKTIFKADKNTEFIVLEVGTNHPGEIEYSAKIAQPDYSFITMIGESHLEFLKDLNGVLEEKYALYKETIKHIGAIFVNIDDELLDKKTKELIERITISFEKKADYEGEIVDFDEFGKATVRIKTDNGIIFDLKNPLYGLANAKNLLYAASIAFHLGVDAEKIKNSLLTFEAVDNRMNVKKFANFMLIEDYYNANPKSMKAAIEYLNYLNVYTKKIAILGDMFELGEHSKNEHEKLSFLLNDSNIQNVLLIGNDMKYLFDKMDKIKFNVKYFDNREEMVKYCENMDIDESIILVKGSRGMKMEDFANIFKNKA